MRPAAAWFTALTVAWFGSSAVAAADGATAEAQRRDLFSVITLAGKHCGAVDEVVEKGASDYSVQCRNGKRFRIHVTDGALRIADLTPAMTTAPSTPEDHRASVARSLFAIVNLSGYECDEVTQFERGPQLQYRVWCRNHTDYRVSVRSGGRLEVAKLH